MAIRGIAHPNLSSRVARSLAITVLRAPRFLTATNQGQRFSYHTVCQIRKSELGITPEFAAFGAVSSARRLATNTLPKVRAKGRAREHFLRMLKTQQREHKQNFFFKFPATDCSFASRVRRARQRVRQAIECNRAVLVESHLTKQATPSSDEDAIQQQLGRLRRWVFF